MQEKWEKRIGVYGICLTKEGLLVIDKAQGPYRKRYDLPGGSIETGETLHDALHREIKEETGLEINTSNAIDTCEFLVPWPTQKFTHLHHTVHLFQVQPTTTESHSPTVIEGQDSAGAHWLVLDQIKTENASPLVLTAKEWLKTQTIPRTLQRLDTWVIKEI
jgi:ADP-ribose pyrophosphatase YjhB (NUDIX family)